MSRRLRLAAHLFRHFGAGWATHRLAFAMARRSGVYARRERFLDAADDRVSSALAAAGFRSPTEYGAYRRRSAPRFFFHPGDRQAFQPVFARWDRDSEPPGARVADIRNGTFRLFGRTDVAAGFPCDWHRSPFTGQRTEPRLHWSRVRESSVGDVKGIWELSRFGCAYALVRHYWRTGDDEAARIFWELLESWDGENPAGRGVNWRCSQEIGLRVMAWCFALYGFLDSSATTDARLSRLARMIWASAHRIALDLPDAISQRNNHGISAATGLLTVALLFPEFPESSPWARRASAVLERLGRELIYEDGAFAQHSLNYHRLMLHDYVWAFRIADVSGFTLGDPLRRRMASAAEFLWQMQDECTGAVPMYGQFDGALVLPLSNCDHLDFRPATVAAGFLASGNRWWSEGPWDEDLLWLFGPRALEAPRRPPERRGLRGGTGGYFTLRSDDGFLATRCARLRHRPGQADLLHVDAWWRGHNVAIDGGTFSYGDDDPGGRELVRTRTHNTVVVDERDQMERFGKFLWFPWAVGTVRRGAEGQSGEGSYWEGEHDGYAARGVRHRRGILQLASSSWLVIDRLDARDPHEYQLHWLMPDVPYEWDPAASLIRLRFESGLYEFSAIAADEGAPPRVVRASADGEGWRSRYYHSIEPALSLSVARRAATQVFLTLLAPAPSLLRRAANGNGIEATAGGKVYQFALGGEGDEPLASIVTARPRASSPEDSPCA